jgi:hypothetical protein
MLVLKALQALKVMLVLRALQDHKVRKVLLIAEH